MKQYLHSTGLTHGGIMASLVGLPFIQSAALLQTRPDQRMPSISGERCRKLAHCLPSRRQINEEPSRGTSSSTSLAFSTWSASASVGLAACGVAAAGACRSALSTHTSAPAEGQKLQCSRHLISKICTTLCRRVAWARVTGTPEVISRAPRDKGRDCCFRA